MADSPDFIELLRALNEKQAEYLIVGGYAVMKYTEPRFTKDLDLWIRNSPENAVKTYHALSELGVPLQRDGLFPNDFTSEHMAYQIGIAPLRVDILTRLSGIQFAEAWSNRVQSTFFGLPVNFISLSDLIINKKTVCRISDLEQLELLQSEKSKDAKRKE